jgi:hypothetical protein
MDFSSPLVGCTRQTTGFNLMSCVLSAKWLISTLGIRLNWMVLPHLFRCGWACPALVTRWLGTNLRGEVKLHLSPPKELGCTLSRLMSQHNHSFHPSMGRQSGTEGSSDALLLDVMGLGIALWPLEKAVAYIRAPCGSLDTSLWARLGARAKGRTCKVGPMATRHLSEPCHGAQWLYLYPT